MIRSIAIALTVVIVSSAQAMPILPLAQQEGLVITVRQGCGLGRQLLDGVCVRNSAVRALVRKCRAKKMRVANGRCAPIVTQAKSQTRPAPAGARPQSPATAQPAQKP